MATAVKNKQNGPRPIYTETLRFQVRPETVLAIEKEAKRRGTTYSAVAREALDKYFGRSDGQSD